MLKNPCHGCTKRRLGCHSDCQDYISWKKDHDDRSALIRSNKVGDDIFAHYRKVNSKGEPK